ncbi:spondin domain-containing protein [Hymenobacter sp. B81]|uniref:spondin domain-containing protein n=1 Tax=Hymenobacter sp. B81 TaxID=3344878 RepID=UPI0037DC8F84
MKRLFLALPLLAACTTDSDVRPDPGPALYRVRFETTWSAATHPQDFPADAHFSRLIGAAHHGAAALFRPGSPASVGIKDLAERGHNAALIGEIRGLQATGAAAALLESHQLYTYVPGELVDTVALSARHPRLSAVTMIAPSPDWFVALESENLLDEAGCWRLHAVVPARAYDAGTDSGPSFASPDQVTSPAQPIQIITNGPLSRNGAVAPLGVFHLDRIR